MIVVFSSWSGKTDARRSVKSRVAGGKRSSQCGHLASAEQARLNLLIRGDAGQVHRNSCVCHRHRAGHQPVVVTPIEGQPWPRLLRLILYVCGLLKFLIMVDAEHALRREVRPQSAYLRIEESRIHSAHHHECRQAVKIRHAGANGKSADFRIVPRDRERNRSIEKHAKVEGVMRVFP